MFRLMLGSLFYRRKKYQILRYAIQIYNTGWLYEPKFIYKIMLFSTEYYQLYKYIQIESNKFNTPVNYYSAELTLYALPNKDIKIFL